MRAGPNPPKGGWRRHRSSAEALVEEQYERDNGATQGRKTGPFFNLVDPSEAFSFTFNYLHKDGPFPRRLERLLGKRHFGHISDRIEDSGGQ
jgi:hypothetical protein